MSHVFRLPIRVYWEDTDAGGIVYHANYLNFAERARTEMVRGMGLSQSDLAAGGQGFAFAVKRLAIEYRKSAKLDDLLNVECEVLALGGASMNMLQRIIRVEDGAVLASLDVTLAFISLKGGPARIPAPIRDALAQLVGKKG